MFFASGPTSRCTSTGCIGHYQRSSPAPVSCLLWQSGRSYMWQSQCRKRQGDCQTPPGANASKARRAPWGLPRVVVVPCMGPLSYQGSSQQGVRHTPDTLWISVEVMRGRFFFWAEVRHSARPKIRNGRLFVILFVRNFVILFAILWFSLFAILGECS